MWPVAPPACPFNIQQPNTFDIVTSSNGCFGTMVHGARVKAPKTTHSRENFKAYIEWITAHIQDPLAMLRVFCSNPLSIHENEDGTGFHEAAFAPHNDFNNSVPSVRFFNSAVMPPMVPCVEKDCPHCKFGAGGYTFLFQGPWTHFTEEQGKANEA